MSRRHTGEHSSDDGSLGGGSTATESPGSSSSHKFRSRFLQALDMRHRKNRSRSSSTNGSSGASREGEPHESPARVASSHGTVSADKDNTREEQPVPMIALSPEALVVSTRIWNAAYDSLGQTNGEMRTIYEKILSNELVGAIAQVTLNTTNLLINCEPDVRMARMRDISDKALIQVQRHETLEAALIEGANAVKSLGDFISQFLDAYPPAAIAVSGVATVLPLLIMPLQANRDMAEGLKHVLERLNWYMGWCQVLLRETWTNDSDFQFWRDKIESKVITLYASLLAFQMKCVCRSYDEHPVTSGLKVWLGKMNWASELATLKALETSTASDMQTYNNQVGTEFLRSLNISTNKLLSHLDGHFREATEARVSKEKDKRDLYQSTLTGRFKTTPYDERMEINNVHVEGTCEWFCTHAAFRHWLVADSGRVLLVSADPGCGKSVLATHLIKSVLPKESPNATICYFFFKDNPEQSELSNAYSSILHNLFLRNGLLADQCKRSIETSGSSMTQQPATLWKIFTEAVTDPRAGPVICVLDALDECSTAGLRMLISHLKDFYSTFWGSNVEVDVRFLLTTRGYPIIIDEFKSLQAHYVQLAGENEREVRAIQKEVDLVVNHRLGELATRKSFDAAQKEKVKNCLKRHGEEQRTYLWAKLIFEVLESEYPENNDRWEDLVNNMPRTVPTAYETLLKRVRPDQKKLVMNLLHIILAAYRPLSLREMNIALMVRDHPGQHSVESLNLASDKSFRNWMITTCGFFVTEYGDKVYLIHQTAKEFLLGTSSSDKTAWPQGGGETIVAEDQGFWGAAVKLAAAHATLAESCVAYLSLETYRSGPARELLEALIMNQRDRRTNFPASDPANANHSQANLELNDAANMNLDDKFQFCEYVIQFWSSHFRHAQVFDHGELISDIQPKYWPHYTAIFEDFDDDRHPGLLCTLLRQEITDIWSPLDANNESQRLVQYTWNFTNSLGITRKTEAVGLQYGESFSVPALAALWGHFRILRETVDNDTFPELPRRNPWLLPFGIRKWVDYQPVEMIDRMPILCAVLGNSVPCLEYLISQKFPVDFRHSNGQTLLCMASKMGYSEVASSLLAHGAKVDLEDNSGLTPLLLTLDRTHGPKEATKRDAVARVLVDNNASLVAENKNGDNALHLAAQLEWSHTHLGLSLPDYMGSLIKFLVDKGAPLEALNHDHKTPLEMAYVDYHHDRFQWDSRTRSVHNTTCLLRSGANPNIRTKVGEPILIDVLNRSQSNTAEIVKQLLRHGAAPDAPTPTGERPLHYASKLIRSSLVSALLHGGANVHAKDGRGMTAIRVAMSGERNSSREDVVIHLLAAGANPDDRDESGRTILHWACKSKDPFLVRRLLDAGADISAHDNEGETPLHYAIASTRHVGWADEPWIEKTIRLLVWRGASLTARANNGQTPLDQASRSRIVRRGRGHHTGSLLGRSGLSAENMLLLPTASGWNGFEEDGHSSNGVIGREESALASAENENQISTPT